MIIIGLFILVLILTVSLTLTYVRLATFVAEHYPNYIGRGLRNKLLGKPISNRGNCANQESIPIKPARNHKSSTSQVAKKTRICGLIQYIIQKMPVFKYRYQEYTYTDTQNSYGSFGNLFSHIKCIIAKGRKRKQLRLSRTQKGYPLLTLDHGCIIAMVKRTSF